MSWEKHRTPLILGATALVYLMVPAILPRGYAQSVWSDSSALILMLVIAALQLRNALRSHGTIRTFWTLLTIGAVLWAISQGVWFWYEVVLRRTMPEPCFEDPILFLHVVPMMAAALLLPHLEEANRRLYFAALNTLTLLTWWVFVYSFVVFPNEFVLLDVNAYSRNYDVLYLVETGLVAAILALAAKATRGRWRRLYLHFAGAMAAYAIGSAALNWAITRNVYYSGSLYDVPFAVSLVWFCRLGQVGADMKVDLTPLGRGAEAWIRFSPRLATLLVMSVPIFGLWTLLLDKSPLGIRVFRISVSLVAIMILGVWTYAKQRNLDISLRRLLKEKNDSYVQLQRLQGELMQKARMDATGQLIAGTAHEINNPLTAIIGYAEILTMNPDVGKASRSIAEKLRQQGQRTKTLVADLLTFALQSPIQRTLVDVGSLVVRAAQTLPCHEEHCLINMKTNLEPDLPNVWANSSRLFEVFLHILNNAADALQNTQGGAVDVKVWRNEKDNEVVIEITDSGPGIKEPDRVFDPFYTTKPVGKGTGLGLSTAYGIVQEHKGQISCCNCPEGGARFTVRLPAATAHAKAAVASGSGLTGSHTTQRDD